MATQIEAAEQRLSELDQEQRELTTRALTRQRNDLGKATRLVWLSGRRSQLQQLMEAGGPGPRSAEVLRTRATFFGRGASVPMS